MSGPSRLNRVGYYSVSHMDFLLNILSSIISSTIGPLLKLFRKKAKPKVEQFYASLPIHHPNTKTCSGRFLVSNAGPRICNINDIKLLSDISLPKLNLAAIGQWPGRSLGDKGAQKLPISIPVNQPKWVFFRTEESTATFRGDLPDSVVMEIRFDCLRKPIRRTLKREHNGHQYKE